MSPCSITNPAKSVLADAGIDGEQAGVAASASIMLALAAGLVQVRAAATQP